MTTEWPARCEKLVRLLAGNDTFYPMENITKARMRHEKAKRL